MGKAIHNISDTTIRVISDGPSGSTTENELKPYGGRCIAVLCAVLMLVCVAIGFLAQVIILSTVRGGGWLDPYIGLIPQNDRHRVGIGISIVAGIIFGWCNRTLGFLVHDSDPSSNGSPKELVSSPRWRPLLAALLVVASAGLLINLLRTYLLSGETFSLRLHWGATVVAFGLAIEAVRRAELGKAERDPAPLFSRRHVIALAFLIIIAFTLRVYDLSHLPLTLNQDNAGAGLWSAENLGRSGWKLVGLGEFAIPQIAFSMLSISQLVFGQTIFGIRIIEAFLGTLLVFGSYLFTWRAFRSHQTALLVTALVACHAGLIHFSRHILNIDPWVFAMFGFTLLIHGTLSHRAWAFGLAGLLLGFSSELYLSARVLFFIIPLFMFYALSYRRMPARLFILSALLMVLGWSVSWGPNLADAYIRPNIWMESNRTQSTLWYMPTLANAIEGYHFTSPLSVLLHQMKPVLLMFQYHSDVSGQFRGGNSFFHHAIAPFIWMGFGICLFSWRRNAGMSLAMIVIGITLFMGQVLQNPMPYWPRIISVMAMGLVLIAIAIESTVCALAQVVRAIAPATVLRSSRAQRLGKLTVSGVLASLCALTGIQEWSTWHDGAIQTGGPVEIAGRVIESLPVTTTICTLRSKMDIFVARKEIQFFGYPRKLLELSPLTPEEAISKCGPEPYVWMINSDQEQLKDLLLSRNPNGKLTTYTSEKFGYVIFWTFSP